MKNLVLAAAVMALMTAPVFAQNMDKEAEYCFKQGDTNGDGSMSKAEWDAYGNKMFTDADSNKDSTITLTEHKDAMARNMQKAKDWVNSNR